MRLTILAILAAALLGLAACGGEEDDEAAATGTVAEVRVQAGQAVNAGDVLIVMG